MSVLTPHRSSLSLSIWMKDQHTQTSLWRGSCGIQEAVKRWSKHAWMHPITLSYRQFPSLCSYFSVLVTYLHQCDPDETGCCQKVLQCFIIDFGSHFNCLDNTSKGALLYCTLYTQDNPLMFCLVPLFYCVTSKNQDLFSLASINEHFCPNSNIKYLKNTHTLSLFAVWRIDKESRINDYVNCSLNTMYIFYLTQSKIS